MNVQNPYFSTKPKPIPQIPKPFTNPMKRPIHTLLLASFLLVLSASTWKSSEDRPTSLSDTKPRINWNTSPLTAAEEKKSLELNFRYESDKPEEFYIYKGYIVQFSAEQRSALWSTHYLPYARVREVDDKGKEIKAGLVRNKYDIPFKRDPNRANPEAQALADEYVNTGFDKGHITPAGDFRNDSLGMLETFYMTNMTAQTPDFNQKVMVTLEDRIRAWINRNHTDCQVITGAIFDATNGRGFGKRGKQVKFPTAHYKIMYAEKDGKSVLYCFLIPHQFGYGDFDLKKYQVSLDTIEKLAKTDFLDKLNDALENKIEAELMDIKNF